MTDVHVIAIVPDPDDACPFYCGTKAVDCEIRNCTDCQHGDRGDDMTEEYEWERCKIRDAITIAMLGPWDPSVNDAMGYDGGTDPPAWCAQRVFATKPEPAAPKPLPPIPGQMEFT